MWEIVPNPYSGYRFRYKPELWENIQNWRKSDGRKWECCRDNTVLVHFIKHMQTVVINLGEQGRKSMSNFFASPTQFRETIPSDRTVLSRC